MTQAAQAAQAEPSSGCGPGPGSPGSNAVGFEEAISLTGFGRFNYVALVALCLAVCCQNFVATEMAYVVPAAECDLRLTPLLKGWINAAFYIGMVSTAFVWGALSDVLGRKWMLVFAFVALALSCAACALADTSWLFIACRVLIGALMIGPASVTLAYAGELFGKEYRSKVFMWLGTIQALGAAVHAGLAMWIIPMALAWLRSWRVFLLCSALLNAATALALLPLPESPKYLASRGRGAEAVAVLRALYAANTGRPKDTYPVEALTLAEASRGAQRGAPPSTGKRSNPFASIAAQFVKLCRPPLLTPLLYALAMQALILFCQNSVRMWVPQIFAEMTLRAEQVNRVRARRIQALEKVAGGAAVADGGESVCTILGEKLSGTPLAANTTGSRTAAEAGCEVFTVDASVYLNSIIIMSSRAGIQLIASLLIRSMGDQLLLLATLVVASASLVAWPLAASTAAVLGLACVYEGAINASFAATMKVIVDLFPTSVRSSAVSLSNFSGRLASLVSNLVFPMLLTAYCPAAFWLGASVLALAALVAAFTPKPSFGQLASNMTLASPSEAADKAGRTLPPPTTAPSKPS